MTDHQARADTFVSRDRLDLKAAEIAVPCQAACPIRTDVPAYIEAIIRRDYREAYRLNRLDNVLPGSLSRVCHRPCEGACRHGRERLGDAVQICFLKRSATDFGLTELEVDLQPNGRTVCIIGAGPAGLTAANDLALRGYAVTVVEQMEEPGGMLRYGIPAFRLPPEVVEQDVKAITDLGVKIETGRRIDTAGQLLQLRRTYDAVVLSAGCMESTRIPVEGSERVGFYWGLDFMMDANRGRLHAEPRRAVVIGGGFTAVDCARTCFRLGAEHVTLAYRRTQDYLRVGKEEVEALAAEGIAAEFLVSPVALEGENGAVTGLRMIRNEINDQGKAQPVAGSEFVLHADTVILATGQSAEDLPGLGDQPESSEPEDDLGLYLVAGDYRHGSGTVVEACADGRQAARRIHQALTGTRVEEVVEITPVELEDLPRWREHDYVPAEAMRTLPVADRRSQDREVEFGFSRAQALTEAHRCYLCHYNFQIDVDACIYCMKCIEVMPVDCIHLVKSLEEREDGTLAYEATTDWSEVEAITIDNNQCIRCGNCAWVCPVDCISVSRYSLKSLEHPADADGSAPGACLKERVNCGSR